MNATRPKPSQEEIEAAVTGLFSQGALCFFSGSITNNGFAATISFNSHEHRTPNGSLVVALRNATFRFDVPVPGARWHEEISELVRTSSRSIQVKEVVARKETDAEGSTLDAAIEGKGTLKVPFFGELVIGSRISESRKREKQQERSRGREEITVRTVHDLEMEQRSPTVFQLTFRAEPESDLVIYNPQLTHLGIIALENPSDIKAEQVRVVMTADLTETDAEVRHSLRVRDATGCWRGLQSTNNHQIVAELLLSKLLRPLHGPTVVWPKGISNGA